MFYKVTLEKLISIPPDKLDSTLNRHLIQYLREAVVGQLMPPPSTDLAMKQDYRSATKSSAIVLAVIDILGAQNLQGKVLDNGFVSFQLVYEALVLKVHRGEVVDVVVDRVAPEGWWGNLYGVGKVFVSRAQMSVSTVNPEWSYAKGVADGSWWNEDASLTIKPGEYVRIRVLGETPQSVHAMMIGTMVGKFLGPL